MKAYFQHFQQLAAAGRYAELDQQPVPKPEFFNWTADIFEGLHAAAHPDKPALLLAGDDGREERFSYGELAAEANRLLHYWRAVGVAPGQAVLLMVPVVAELWFTYLAGIKGGQLIVPTATIMSVRDLEYRFSRLLPAVVIADDENAAKIDQAEQALGARIGLKMLVGAGSRPGWAPFAATREQPAPTQVPAAPTRADDPLFLFFTSGTTGQPKVVTHTHFSYPVGHLSTAAWIGIRPNDLHCNISQAGWAKFAWSSFFAPLNVGATLFVYRQSGKFAAPPLLQALQQYGISTFCAPPTVLRLLILEDLKQYRFSFRECVSAGEPLNPEVIDAWQQGTGLTIRDGYGQTESTAMVYNLPGSAVRFGSMGRASFMYDVVVADDEGRVQPDLEEGHIAVRMDTDRPNGIFKEYFGEPERAASVFRHGLYYTGDKAYRDADGYVWFVGRDDDVIKSSDYRVGPFEVESALIDHPAVVEAAVVGSPHPIKGHEIKAFVILHAEARAGEELATELFAFCRATLAPYKMPRLLEFVAELPKTISGKIRRVELRAQEEQHRRSGQPPRPDEYFYQPGQ